ncbi:helix-turn-helix domain-containing protein [Roseibium sediminicola]|uniref:Helix-turn-helix domain-containing protein n=1 Tax=Roseibium sediminicola TaxID=2933272 RepID=A0ABT0GRC7_9HYPH|nr:helix-turn-helix transcriptional regulator [Roseibium sp. CAU 1639]MCK7611992.1 helix-turn-helix domain-containing protein [Roseibium sp. CAU 1639]
MSIIQGVSISCETTPTRMEKNERLKKARIDAGYSTASDAARALDVKIATYSHHESGDRDFKDDAGRRYARRFGVDFVWLMHGEQLKQAARPKANSRFHEGITPDSDKIDWDAFYAADERAQKMQFRMTGGGMVDQDTYDELVLHYYRQELAAKSSKSE